MAVGANVIRLLGRYSEGLRLAAEHGTHSGVVRDYAYRNRPQGFGPLGWLADRLFLHQGRWNTLRHDVRATTALLEEVLERRRALGWPTMILDVAAGSAPYLRELARDHGGDDLTIECLDRDPGQVTQARELVRNEGLARFSISVGDATDDASYLTRHDPDLILAIDIFPWLAEDEAVRTAIQLAFDHLHPGGCFICTTLTRVRTTILSRSAGTPAKAPALRSPEPIVDCMQTTGFVGVEVRPIYGDGCALLGWKPPEPPRRRQATVSGARLTNP